MNQRSTANALLVADLYAKMTFRERKFWDAYVGPCKMSAVDAYQTISPNVSRHVAKVNGSRMLGLIREKAGGREGLLEMFGLGIDRMFYELDLRLKATKVELYQGVVVADPISGTDRRFEDNATRMAATKLLAEVHGARKTELVHSGSVGVVSLTPEEREARIAEIVRKVAG